ncbi:ZIP family metal transporter [Patiriisocius hiemis]|uniref:ZIP family metal transporter n=1 Tax=Patiriisocius hiemis TaxID=3075604 RepID=A0ABU2YF53_9FLAO|nr:ZIP family metal transporter [Constantimarinum sp. W242]MDT0556824.1 ZIP family metal transporter [Constantimarinum sp. W242]
MVYILLIASVLIGYIIAVSIKTKEPAFLPILLAFSGSFLLSTTLFELLPEVFTTPSKKIGLFIMGGILLQIILDFFSKGAEHGHVHIHSEKKAFPWLLFISLSIHALLEGHPITGHDAMLWGVIVHKIPIAIILSLFFKRAAFSSTTTILFLFLFALMTPLGSWITSETSSLSRYQQEINAIVIGIFLHVSTTILFESSKNHSFNFSKMTAVIIAAVIAYFI